MINICLNFVKSFQEIIDKQEMKKSNIIEIYFFIMFFAYCLSSEKVTV